MSCHVSAAGRGESAPQTAAEDQACHPHRQQRGQAGRTPALNHGLFMLEAAQHCQRQVLFAYCHHFVDVFARNLEGMRPHGRHGQTWCHACLLAHPCQDISTGCITRRMCTVSERRRHGDRHRFSRLEGLRVRGAVGRLNSNDFDIRSQRLDRQGHACTSRYVRAGV